MKILHKRTKKEESDEEEEEIKKKEKDWLIDFKIKRRRNLERGVLRK
jgi:hypothetical protein